MEISLLLMQQIAELFLMIFMGYVIVKAGLLKGEDSKVISKIVLYLILGASSRAYSVSIIGTYFFIAAIDAFALLACLLSIVPT